MSAESAVSKRDLYLLKVDDAGFRVERIVGHCVLARLAVELPLGLVQRVSSLQTTQRHSCVSEQRFTQHMQQSNTGTDAWQDTWRARTFQHDTYLQQTGDVLLSHCTEALAGGLQVCARLLEPHLALLYQFDVDLGDFLQSQAQCCVDLLGLWLSKGG